MPAKSLDPAGIDEAAARVAVTIEAVTSSVESWGRRAAVRHSQCFGLRP